MNQNYAKKGKYFPDSDGVREAAEAVSHSNLEWFFSKYVSGVEEIPWNDFFRTVGLRLQEQKTTVADAGFQASRNFDGPMMVAAVNAGSEADRAGLHSGDVILEVNGRSPGQDFSEEIAGVAPGDTITVKAKSRRGAERELKWKVGSRDESLVRSQRCGYRDPGAAGSPRGVVERRGARSSTGASALEQAEAIHS